MNRLIIIIDMHETDALSKTMENATALLLTNRHIKVDGEKTVYLFRPLFDVTDAEDTLPVYFKTRQVKEPRTLWYTGLSRSLKYPLMKVLDDNKLAADRLNLEGSFGDTTEGYRWLGLALAADAVRYAQGPQCVATSTDNKLSIVALSSQLPQALATRIDTHYSYPWQSGGLSGIFTIMSILTGLVAFNAEYVNTLSGGFLLFLIITPLVIGLLLGSAMTVYAENKARDDMWRG